MHSQKHINLVQPAKQLNSTPLNFQQVKENWRYCILTSDCFCKTTSRLRRSIAHVQTKDRQKSYSSCIIFYIILKTIFFRVSILSCCFNEEFGSFPIILPTQAAHRPSHHANVVGNVDGHKLFIRVSSAKFQWMYYPYSNYNFRTMNGIKPLKILILSSLFLNFSSGLKLVSVVCLFSILQNVDNCSSFVRNVKEWCINIIVRDQRIDIDPTSASEVCT